MPRIWHLDGDSMENLGRAPTTTQIDTDSSHGRPDSGTSTDDTGGVRYRSIFLSDIHLGSPDCRADALIDFLRHTECERLYLVGDIFDFWALKRQWFWPQSHNDVIQKLLRKVRKGTKIIYVPGNHDEAARTFSGFRLGGISVSRETMHVTADGRRLLVLHGDQFDAVLGYPSFFPIGASAWRLLRFAARALNLVLGWFGRRQWSLAGMLAKAQDGIGLKTRFRELVREEARARGFDGVLCGHLHWPEHDDREGLVYLNTLLGPWRSASSGGRRGSA